MSLALFPAADPNQLVAIDVIGDLQRDYTSSQFDALLLNHCRLIKEQRLGKGDAVTVLAANSTNSIAFLLAALACGLRLAPLNRQLTAREIRQQHQTLGASLLFCDKLLEPQAVQLGLPVIIFCDDTGVPGKVNHEPMGLQSTDQESPELAGELCFFTSATTGSAKAVLRHQVEKTFQALLDDWRLKGQSFGLDGKGVHLLVGPTYHAAPLLYALFDFLNGATLVIMERWAVPQVLEVIERFHVTNTHFVPTCFKRLLELDKAERERYQLDSLQRIYHGAAPITVALKKRCIEWLGPVLVEYWGASECGTCCLVDSQQWLEKPGTVGRAVGQVELQVRDPQETSKQLPAGEQGKVFARFKNNPAPFSYLNDPDKTAATLDEQGWFQLGDLGYLDEEGFLYLSGRESHTIISGGVNIYPAEVEALLLEHPLVEDVLVYARPDEDKGEKAAALIQCKTGLDAPELEQYLENKLARYKWPRYWFFCNKMPVNEAGKITRSALQQSGYL